MESFDESFVDRVARQCDLPVVSEDASLRDDVIL